MIEIALKDVEKYYGANHVLKGVSFDIKQGERAGLLGRNGTGKTTLFRIMAGLDNCDAGSRMLRKGAAVGILDQIPLYPDGYTAYDVLYSAFEEVHVLHGQMHELENLMSKSDAPDEILAKYGRLQQKFELLNGYAIEDDITRVCKGLKIDECLSETEFNRLSGGEQTRVMLGRLILQRPDVILLDEPTNHLDLSSIEWLEDFLSSYKGTAVIISHDRYFLDRVVNRIVEIVNGKAELYEGNYSRFTKEKEERYLSQLERYEQEQKKIRQLEAAAKRMHEWAKMADNPAMHRRAFSMEKRIERMDKTEKPLKDQEMVSMFNEYGFSGKDVISASNIVKSFEGRPVLDNADFSVKKGERVAILGNNGSGKTTLLKCITGDLQVDGGFMKVGESIRPAHLPQVVTYDNPGLSILETARIMLGISEGDARGLLAKYRFKKEDVHKVVGNLSGGEKSRLRLCILMQADVNLLLLDEPTNHLDIESREWLENALMEFDGTIVFISHDRYFINKFATRISELQNGRIYDYFGDYEFYKARAYELEKKKAEVGPLRVERKPVRQMPEPAESIGESIKAKCGKLESLIAETEARLAETESEMQANADDYGRLDALYREKVELEGRLDGLYKEWEALLSS